MSILCFFDLKVLLAEKVRNEKKNQIQQGKPSKQTKRKTNEKHNIIVLTNTYTHPPPHTPQQIKEVVEQKEPILSTFSEKAKNVTYNKLSVSWRTVLHPIIALKPDH